MDVNYGNNQLFMDLKTNDCGTTLNPYLVYSGFTGLEENEIRKWPLIKESVEI